MNSEKYDLLKTCRTCLKMSDNQMCWLYLEFNNTDSKFPICIIDELILMKLKISRNDGLPQQICMDCTNRIKEYNAFRKESERSQEILEKYFKEPKSIVEVVPAENAQMTMEHIEIEFIYPDVKEEIIVNNNNRDSNFIHCYNSNNNNTTNDSIMTGSVNPNYNLNDTSIECVELEIEKLQNESVKTHCVNDRVYCKNTNDQILNKIDNNYISYMEQVNNHDDGGDEDDDNDNVNDGDVDDGVVEDYDDDDNNDDVNNNNYIDSNVHGDNSVDVVDKCPEQTYDNEIQTNSGTEKIDDDQLYTKIFRDGKCIGRYYSTQNNISPSGKLRNNNLTSTVKITTCTYCKQKFHNTAEVQQHIKTEHPTDRPYICSICNKGFTKPANRTRHMHIHFKAYPFKCLVCGKCCKSERTLNIHKQNNHPNGAGEFCCPHCSKVFAEVRQYVRHLKTECSLPMLPPSQQTQELQSLQAPAETLSTDAPKILKIMNVYKCRFCEKIYSLLGHAIEHERTHTVVCSKVLEKDFNDQRSQEHIPAVGPSGLQLQLFKCNLCATTFTRQADINHHMELKHKVLSLPTV